jgi:hypothetical protein
MTTGVECRSLRGRSKKLGAQGGTRLAGCHVTVEKLSEGNQDAAQDKRWRKSCPSLPPPYGGNGPELKRGGELKERHGDNA